MEGLAGLLKQTKADEVQVAAPVHHVVYLYDYAGQLWKTQRLVRTMENRLYKPGPPGGSRTRTPARCRPGISSARWDSIP
jgi:putative alpha-1,2-mannosidase